MEWVQSLFSGEGGTAMQLVVITVALVASLILVVWLFRRLAGSPAKRAAAGRVPRISITDVAAVDDKRFLVLARRDNVEHLVLIGGPTDVVVESGIEYHAPVQQHEVADPQSPARHEMEEEQAHSPKADDAVAPAALAVGSAMAAANDTMDPAEQLPEASFAASAGAGTDEIEIHPPEPEQPADTYVAESELQSEESVTAPAEPAQELPEPDEQIVEIEVDEEVRIEAAISENLEDGAEYRRH